MATEAEPTAERGRGRSPCAIQPSKKRRSAILEIVADHDADLLEAAPRELPAPQARCLDADEHGDQQPDPATGLSSMPRWRSANVTPATISSQAMNSSHIRCRSSQSGVEQEGPEMEAVAHEHEARRVRDRVVVAVVREGSWTV